MSTSVFESGSSIHSLSPLSLAVRGMYWHATVGDALTALGFLGNLIYSRWLKSFFAEEADPTRTLPTEKDDGVNVEGGAEGVPEVSVGGKVEASKQAKTTAKFESGDDIVFAYQLLKIKPKGWTRNKTIAVDEYQPKGALLADGEEEEPTVEGEKDILTWDDLMAASNSTEIVRLEFAGVGGETFTA